MRCYLQYMSFALSSAIAAYGLWGFDAALLTFALLGCAWVLRDTED